jgi:predicted Kef-type K+ transport protein
MQAAEYGLSLNLAFTVDLSLYQITEFQFLLNQLTLRNNQAARHLFKVMLGLN